MELLLLTNIQAVFHLFSKFKIGQFVTNMNGIGVDPILTRLGYGLFIYPGAPD